MLHQIYQKLPLPHSLRTLISSKVPNKYRRQPHLRSFGVINDLYPWRTDEGLDTIAPIQNFFSALFPGIDTIALCHVWFYDKDGNLINQHQFTLAPFGFHELRASDFVPKNSYGSFMWHIQIPEVIAEKPEIQNGLVYFTDRGYICFEKDNCQPAFVHGIDRYSVFQKRSVEKYDLFYKSPTNRKWTAEFPLTTHMQKTTEIILINRTNMQKKYELTVFENGGSEFLKREITIPSRGVGIFKLDDSNFHNMSSDHAYFSVDGIPTPCGRPAIMRHFKSGAISIMHC
jgi:hypothetical protein